MQNRSILWMAKKDAAVTPIEKRGDSISMPRAAWSTPLPAAKIDQVIKFININK